MSESKFYAAVSVDAETVLEGLSWDRGAVFEFMIEMDELMADLHFTADLRDKLNDVIEKELES